MALHFERDHRGWVASASTYLRSLYPTSWPPFLVCSLTSWYWFGDFQHCKCCLYAATDPRRRGPTLADIQYAARSGCVRCAIIAKGLSKFTHLWQIVVSEDGQFEEIPHDIHFRRHMQSVSVSTSKRSDGIGAWKIHFFRFYLNEDAPNLLTDLILRNGVAPQSNSDECFSTIKAWLHDCVVKHQSCRTKTGMASEPFLPARMIQVHDIKLVPREYVADQTSKYAALSHSWGLKAQRKQPIPKLQNANIEDRKRGIDWAELTRTFQDAILAARRLELEYIWIDSLCIIKDNKDDWVAQSMQMAKIYGEAHVVISATRSHTGDMGIFNTRPAVHDVSLDGMDSRTVVMSRQLKHDNFFIAHKPSFDGNPLFTRGWCFQERLLAKRIIHFTEDEAVWECNEDLSCECQGIKTEAEDRKEGHSTSREFKAKFNTLLHSGDAEERDQCWMHILEGYSARELTVETDRLPALSGIAQQVSRPEKGRYLAGLWEGDLPNSLLWYLPMKRRELRSNIERIPGVPSWSWPSVGTEITPHYQKMEHFETTATVLEVHCSLPTSDPFGEVNGGYIILDAPIVEVNLADDEVGYWHLLNPDDKDDQVNLFPDSYSSNYLPPNGSTVYCVGIEFDSRPGHKTGFFCVIVRNAETSGDFCRIGQTNCPSLWIERAKRKEIKII